MTLTAPRLLPAPVINELNQLWENILLRETTPTEDRRIFLFLDLNSSTNLAERLGHINYSMFLSACFDDFERCRKIIGGEVYQFVGDEVITSWKFSQTNIENCVQLAVLFRKELFDKRSRYLNEFGYAPVFKAAMHEGKVAATTIARQKTFHGDVLNTCSRMKEIASTFKLGIVASEKIAMHCSQNQWDELNDTSIRGKQNHVKIFSMR